MRRLGRSWRAPIVGGRPRGFDEEQALEKATQVFWSQGYDGVTIDDLVAGLGRRTAEPVCCLWGQADVVFASPHGLCGEESSSRREGAAVATTNSRLAPCLPEERRRDCDPKRMRRDVFSSASRRLWTIPRSGNSCKRGQRRGGAGGRAIRGAITAGEIPADFPVPVRASQVMDFGRGLTMSTRIDAPRKTLLGDAEEAANLALLTPPR